MYVHRRSSSRVEHEKIGFGFVERKYYSPSVFTARPGPPGRCHLTPTCGWRVWWRECPRPVQRVGFLYIRAKRSRARMDGLIPTPDGLSCFSLAAHKLHRLLGQSVRERHLCNDVRRYAFANTRRRLLCAHPSFTRLIRAAQGRFSSTGGSASASLGATLGTRSANSSMRIERLVDGGGRVVAHAATPSRCTSTARFRVRMLWIETSGWLAASRARLPRLETHRTSQRTTVVAGLGQGWRQQSSAAEQPSSSSS